MRQTAALVNAVYEYQTPFEVLISDRYPDSTFTIYDVYSLVRTTPSCLDHLVDICPGVARLLTWPKLPLSQQMSDIWQNPSQYLNGTVPFNVTGYITGCGSACSDASVRDSYMWYDPLHPSEQTTRIIAREFVDIVNGNGTWSKTWTSAAA